ncbi:AAA family ATPase, partial [Bacteroidales bacterium AH-315-N07]|nr:AAA family ATPase [Bacteroidales bacterium AH-315-N07]
MAKIKNSIRKEIIHKKKILEEAQIQLKKEFVGIDDVIDEVIKGVSYWYMFPELQETPAIINLWGMTGIGKTSLVSRLANLIGYDKNFYLFNLGKSTNGWHSIERDIKDLYENLREHPAIIVFDEFQLARTKEEEKELRDGASRVIWELLDNGKFNFYDCPRGLSGFYELIAKLNYLLIKGVKVTNGKVVTKKLEFILDMELEYDYTDIDIPARKKKTTKPLKITKQDIPFVPENYHDDIWTMMRGKFKNPIHVKEELAKLNGDQTMKLLWKVFDNATSPIVVDCSRSLIFVVGNLDEAYLMSNDFNPDRSADEFHEQSLKVNITHIKKALKKRFRNEQIARLGNYHIIYPGFNEDSFYKIIELELNKIKEKVDKSHGLNLHFDKTIVKMIYQEGVYPTQGTRPLFSTINQIIKTKIGRIFTEMIMNELDPQEIVMNADKDLVIVDYICGGKKVHSFSEKQTLNLEKVRRNRRDDNQAITAVHECGHAILSICAMKTIPEVIYSVTAESDIQGFVYTKYKNRFIAKNQMINRLAVFLGGLVAEKLVFGDNNFTTGASDDLQRATEFITSLLKECGMGKSLGSYQVKNFRTNNYLHDMENAINMEAQEFINDAHKLAESILSIQWDLLLKMSEYLADNRCMKKDQIKDMAKRYLNEDDDKIKEIISNEGQLFYREHLKRLSAQIADSQPEKKYLPNVEEVSLNKG